MAKAFDLSTLSANIRQEADDAASFIRARFNRDVAEIGERLTAVKAALPHGAFVPWLAANLSITFRTAQRYMQAAEFLGGKNDIVSHLPPTVVAALSRPDTPAEIVSHVVNVAERGEQLDVRGVKSDLQAAASARRMRENEEKRARQRTRRRAAR